MSLANRKSALDSGPEKAVTCQGVLPITHTNRLGPSTVG